VRVRWSDRARIQILEIFRYIASDRPTAAEGLLERFLERVELLAEFPEQGSVWGKGRRPDLREIIFESHRIVYRVGPDEVSILSVRHTQMRPDDLGQPPDRGPS
jgi:plasmid stabilization system protein ParE